MPEFQMIRRQDVPNAWQIGTRLPEGPTARLHSTGTIFFSVVASQALGDKDCRVVIEFEEKARTLKFTVAEKLPNWVSEEDTFPMRIRTGPHNRRPTAMISCKALFSFIGFKWGKAKELEIVAIDPASRSITVALPPE